MNSNKYTQTTTQTTTTEKEIDLNFLEELKRLRPGYHHQPNVT